MPQPSEPDTETPTTEVINLDKETFANFDNTVILRALAKANPTNTYNVEAVLRMSISILSEIKDMTPKELICNLFDEAPKDEDWKNKLKGELRELKGKVENV